MSLLARAESVAGQMRDELEKAAGIGATAEGGRTGSAERGEEAWQALRAREERFRLLVENSHDILFEMDPGGVFTFVSPRIKGLLGWEPSRLEGRSAFELVHPEDVPKIANILAEAVAAPAARTGIDYRYRHLDGSWRCMETSAVPRFDVDGGLVAIVGNTRDITEVRKVEDEIRQSEARFRTLLQWVPSVAVQGYGPDGTTQYWNAASEKLYGYSAEEAIGRNLLDLIIPPEMKEGVREAIGQMIATGEPIPSAELSLMKKGGERVTVYSSHVVVRRWNFPAELFCLDVDLTDRVRAEEALRTSEAKVRVLNSDLERHVAARTADLEAFSYTVAHDLKAPLRGIDGFAGMLLEDEGERLTDEGRRMVGRIRAASQRGGRLIDDLLRLSRLTKADLHVGRVDLSSVAGAVAERIRALEPARQVEWVIEPGLTVTADAGLLEEVLDQLLANAWKFTSKKELARIEFGGTEREGKRAFLVRDNGAGFDMAHAGELFGAFHRAHTDAEFPGLGIGLAIVAKIVQRHGGTVWAEGEAGKGTTVLFTLG